MIFEHTWPMVMQGNKTRTSRLQKPGDVAVVSALLKAANISLVDGRLVTSGLWSDQRIGAVERKGKKVYQVGHTYAVQPGRTQPAIWWQPETGSFQVGRPTRLPARRTWQQARIRVTGIEQQDVRNISLAEAKAEGFTGEIGFWQLWCLMHDPKLLYRTERPGRFADSTTRTVVEIRRELFVRPDKHYLAWVLYFELVT